MTSVNSSFRVEESFCHPDFQQGARPWSPRFRRSGGFTLVELLGPGDYRLENVTVLEAGDFGFDLSAGAEGKVVVKNCRCDVAYNPVFNLTRGELPKNALTKSPF